MKSGFIQIIIILILLLIILSLLGVSLSSLFSNPILKENFGFLGNKITWVWNNYLSSYFWYFFETFRNFIWTPFLDIMRGIKGGGNNVSDIFKNK